MVKGAQKQIIVLKPNSRYFDEAYFILRRELCGIKIRQDDMVEEANKILSECGEGKKRHPVKASGFFWIGAVSGAILSALIFLLL